MRELALTTARCWVLSSRSWSKWDVERRHQAVIVVGEIYGVSILSAVSSKCHNCTDFGDSSASTLPARYSTDVMLCYSTLQTMLSFYTKTDRTI
jgi:hypothetical protein